MSIPFTLAPQIEDILVTALKARPGLADVQVEVGPLGDSTEAGGHFLVGVGLSPGGGVSESVQTDVTWHASGGFGRREEVTIHCQAFGIAPSAGPATIREARDAAFAICQEVEDELREAVAIGSNHPILLDGRVKNIEITGWSEFPFADPGDRISVVQLNITYIGDLS